MKIVHLSVTPLAGSPIRIVNALNSHTCHSADLIVLDPDTYGPRTFEGGYHWDNDRDKCVDLISSADLLHVHHYFDLQSTANPFNFNFSATGKPVIRQFHTHPLTIAKGDPLLADFIVADSTPSLVIAQYHERFFPNARVVPNIVPINDAAYLPVTDVGMPLIISFSPSVSNSAWSISCKGTRFDTKGAPETIQILNKIQDSSKCIELQIITGKPHSECLSLKRSADIAIDDLVTGSYHLSSLEFLSMGKPTLCFIDKRVEQVIKDLTGCSEIPWVNTRLEEAEHVLAAFIRDSDLRNEFGRESRKWMETYWDDAKLVSYYVSAYFDLLNEPARFGTPRFDLKDSFTRWLVQDQFEVSWHARQLHASTSASRSWYQAMNSFIQKRLCMKRDR